MSTSTNRITVFELTVIGISWTFHLPCRWYADVKARNRDSLLHFL